MDQFRLGHMASRSAVYRPARDGVGTSLIDDEEGQLLKLLCNFFYDLGNSEMRRLWNEELKKAIPPRDGHRHAHRKLFMEGLLTRLSEDSGNQFSTPKPARDRVRLEVMEALEIIARNDAHYAAPDP